MHTMLPPGHRAMLINNLSSCSSQHYLDTLDKSCDTQILKTLLSDLLESAERYTQSVCRFQEIVETEDMASDARQQIELVRGSIHDALIDNVNILYRALNKAGKNTSWYDKVSHDRSSFGFFALLISFENLLREEENHE